MAVMALVVIALAMFASGRIPLETSSLVILGLLVVGFELFPYTVDGATLHPSEFFYGFGHEALVGVIVMLATRCLEWDDLTSALSAPVVMIVVASLALGLALMRTGGADYVARLYVAVAAGRELMREGAAQASPSSWPSPGAHRWAGRYDTPGRCARCNAGKSLNPDGGRLPRPAAS